MKVILIPVSNRPECVVALQQGFVLGDQLKASVLGYHIRPHSKNDVSLPTETAGSIVTTDSYDKAWEATIKKSSEGQGHIKAKTLFKNTAQQFNYELIKKPNHKPAAHWFAKVGSPDRLFSIMGPVSDLIVVSRPSKLDKSKSRVIMLSAVINSSSPVLVLPQNDYNTQGKRISIAWNQSTAASLAVKAAMPLLKQADEVNIITCGAQNKPGPKAKHLARYLSHWNISTNHVKAKGSNDTEAILNGYNKSESDLLIMGGYSHSRLRQRVFGGVTEYMLNAAEIPVFILHT